MKNYIKEFQEGGIVELKTVKFRRQESEPANHYGKYYEQFEGFQKATTNCLKEAETKHKKASDSLLTLKFQTFADTRIMTL